MERLKTKIEEIKDEVKEGKLLDRESFREV